MKAIRFIIVTAWILAIQANTLEAQSFKAKTYKVTVQGTSTVHDWESAVENLDCKGSFTVANNTLTGIKDVVVKIPVTSIKSTKGRMMDNKTYDAFNHDKHPAIIFIMNSNNINEGNATLDVKGNLTMAGVTKAIDFTLDYKLLPNGDLQIKGSKKLTMTDFKMDPPTAMMGTIKVGNEVVVTFEMVLTTNHIESTKL